MDIDEDFYVPFTDDQLAGARIAADDLIPEPTPEPETYDKPQAEQFKKTRRKNGANEYEKRLRNGVNTAVRFLGEHEATVPDAAAVVMYGPKFAETWADAAAADPRIGAAIDFFTTPTESPIAVALMSTVPLVCQLMRNHEPQLEPSVRGIKIPFLKRHLNVKLGLKLKRLRPLTHDPKRFSDYVFTDENIRQSFLKQGINVAGYIRAD